MLLYRLAKFVQIFLLLNIFQGREIQQQQHKFIVRKNLINYTVPQVAKTNVGRREEQLRVRV